MKDLSPTCFWMSAFLEVSSLQGRHELIPVVPGGVGGVNDEFVVVGSHGGGTVKVTERFDR